MGNIVGEEFKDYVRGQIQIRQTAHGSGVDSLRDNGTLSYLNSKTSWVKLASGVSISGSKLEKLSGNINTPQNVGMGLAQNNILFGGTSTFQKNKPIKPKHSNMDISGYDHSNEWGVVPMSGIESMDLKTLNRGSLEKATIKLKAYSREQFDIIDVLYLRLGYTVLLEWGNSTYLDNKGNPQTMGGTVVEDPIRFFSEKTKDSYLSILGPIEYYRRKYQGNYDGLLGKISNFDWSFNSDGSYDISITIISLGDVIESLKSNISTSSEYLTFIEKVTQNDKDGENKKTIGDDISSMLWTWKFVNRNNKSSTPISINLGKSNNKIKNYIGRFMKTGKETLTGTSWTIYKSFIRKSTLPILTEQELSELNITEKIGFLKNGTEEEVKEYIQTNKKIQDELPTPLSYIYTSYYFPKKWSQSNNPLKRGQFDEKSAFFLNVKEDQEHYLKFGDFLRYIQNVIIPSIQTKNENTPLFEIDLGYFTNNKMYSLPNQISLDPRVCLVRNDKFQKLKKLDAQVLSQLSPFRVDDYAKDVNPNAAYLFNIYLNFNFITESLESNMNERGDVGLFGLLDSICSGLNKALGGINNLEPVVDKVTNTLKIIDTTPIPGLTELIKKDPPYALQIYGYNNKSKNSNFVRNINLKTAITPEYATMVTVGATAGGYVKGVEATAFSKWNSGLEDRFNNELKNNIASDEDVNEAVINYANFLNDKNLSKCYGFSGIDVNTTGPKTIKFDSDAIASNLSIGTEFYRYLQSKNQSGGSVGFIPFKMSLTLDGISGIKIYDKLHIDSRFLPSNYGDTLDLLVTGISHKLSNNDWETDIQTTAMSIASEIKNLDSIGFDDVVEVIEEGNIDATHGAGNADGTAGENLTWPPLRDVIPKLYPNLRYNDGAVGSSKPSQDRVNPTLLSDMNSAAVTLGIIATITTAITGHKAGSRHNPSGTGVDVAIIDNLGSGHATNSTNGNAQFRTKGTKFKNALVSLGYTWNKESGEVKAVLWQTNIGGNHFNHLHISSRI